MRNLPRLLERAALNPVQILPSTHHSVLSALAAQLASPSLAAPAIDPGGRTQGARQSVSQVQQVGRTAVIPLSGIMMKHATFFDVDCAGAACLEEVTENLEAAASSPDIDRIVLYIDSPGGEVIGAPELADVVRSISESDDTEMVAFTDSLMASAGYYVGSQAEVVLATQSAMVGSINTYVYLIDYSEHFEELGLKPELFTEGKFKGMGLPGLSLTDEQREFLQERVKVVNDAFHAAVQAGRDGMVPAEAMEGQTFSGQQAQDNGLIDAVVSDVSAAIDYVG